MKTDAEIQKCVMDELKYQPFLQAAEIGVAVKDGVVTLSGEVDYFNQKLTAERVTKNIAGVKAIAEDIQVGRSPATNRSDTDIAIAALNTLKWTSGVDEDRIQVRVENGMIRLEGETDWAYQRGLAENAVKNLTGVKSVTNLISIKQQPLPEQLEQKISAALHRSATLDSDKITVSVNGSEVTLNGQVRSLSEKDDAALAVWAAPGVYSVRNQLTVDEPELAF